MKGDYNEFHVVRDGDTIRYTCSIIPANNMLTIRLLAFFVLCTVIVFSLFSDFSSGKFTFLLFGILSILLIAASLLPRPYTKYEWNLKEASVKKVLVYASRTFTRSHLTYVVKSEFARVKDTHFKILAYNLEQNEYTDILFFETEYEVTEIDKLLKSFHPPLSNLDLPENRLKLYRSTFKLLYRIFSPGTVADDSSFGGNKRITWYYQKREIHYYAKSSMGTIQKYVKTYPQDYTHHIRYIYDSYNNPAALVLYAKPSYQKEAKGFDIDVFSVDFNIKKFERIIQANMSDFKILDWHE